MTNSNIALRPIRPEDEAFLYRVYASTREDEMALVDWTGEQKESFLRMQFSAQHRYYRENYLGALFQLILLDGQPVGRLYTVRWDDQIRIIDIALLPAFRGRGIGSELLIAIFDEALQAGLPVTIHVEQYNPALRLYHRLGFRKIGEFGIYHLMERRPDENAVDPSQERIDARETHP